MKQIFLILSIVISLIAYVVGIRRIAKGTFRPQRMTRFLLAFLALIFVMVLWAQGDRNALYLALVMFLCNFIVFGLSIKNGIGGTSRLDMVVLFMAIVSLAVWQMTDNPVLGLVMSIVTDFIAMVPTIIKSWVLPETEEWWFYISGTLSGMFNIFSITKFTFGTLAFPVYVFLVCTATGLIIVLRGSFLKKNKKI